MLTVTELTRRIKRELEGNTDLQNVTVRGEVSNLTRHRSGHLYFSLKDEGAQVSAMMFKDDFRSAGQPAFEEGQTIEANGSISVYAPRGTYSLVVRRLKAAGLGELFQQFLEVKQRLQDEGLFDEARKRPLPRFPKTIAVITSPTGAVIRDIITTLGRRYPHADVLLFPASVQGAQAVPSLLRALDLVRMVPEIEVVILARGGGSIEDLWPFNDESLARAIAACPVPIVSAVGHQTDTTIADFVADLRAPTPTAAAEQVAPEAEAIYQWLEEQKDAFADIIQRRIEDELRALDEWQDELVQPLLRRLQTEQRQIVSFRHELQLAAQRIQTTTRNELALLAQEITLSDPRAILRQGFTLTHQDNKRLHSAKTVDKKLPLVTYFEDGKVTSQPLD